MNVLKITLNEDGKSIKKVLQDFNIIRGSYADILISLEVPKSLLVDVVTDENGTITTGNIVRVGGIIYTSIGKNLVTQSYEFIKIKDFKFDGIDYCLYQRKMPKAFTMWETVNSSEEGTNAGLSLKIEVVNFTLQSDGYQTEEINATSTITLDVYPGATLEGEEAEDPSDFEILQSTVNDISDDVTDLQEHISSLSASEISVAQTGELTATTVQEAIEQLEARTDEKYVSSVTGQDDYLVDNTDDHNPIIMHDTSKVDVSTFDSTVDELNTAITTNANGISEINTNLQSYSLISNTGAKIDLDINTTNYLMTLSLKNSDGETLSSDTIDFPLESMVVGASYADGNLTLTLQNGTTLDIDISSIIDGLVNSSELENYVKNTDYATNSVFGIVRADQINGIQASNGVLSIMGATDTQVDAKASNGRPLQAKHIDKIVQLGITTNTNTLTEEEQASAQEWIGISGVTDVINTYKYVILEEGESL